MRSLPVIIVCILSMMAFTMFFTSDAEGAPSILSVTLLPGEPTVDDDINVTVVVEPDGETVNSVMVLFCIDPLCFETIFLSDDGSGTIWSGIYPNDHFQNTTGHFNITVSMTGGHTLYEDLYLDFAGVPGQIILDPIDIKGSTIYPNQTISASGQALYDLGRPPEEVLFNLSVPSLGIYNTTKGDDEGNFFISLVVPDEGTHTVNLTATDGNLTAYHEWTVIVNRWPVPQMVLDADPVWDPLDAPPGTSGGRIYTSSNITLEYFVSNRGTGLASNVTVNITVDNSTISDIVYLEDLLINNTYEGSKVLNIKEAGEYTIRIAVTWDQLAPRDQNITDPVWSYHFIVVDRPVWEEHTPLVELFTSTTCEYCVAAEEAIERLIHQGDVEFNTITYILDDVNSDAIGEARGVVGTPMVKVDHEFISINSVDGEGTRVENWEAAISEAVNEAARRDTPPVNLQFSNDGPDWSQELEYSPLARENVTGTLHINLVEQVSDIRRNHQKYPMSYRFMETIIIKDIPSIEPGTFEEISIGEIPEGMGIVSILYDQFMDVIQTGSVFPHSSPGLFMEKGNVILRSESPNTLDLFLTLETFPMEEGTFADMTYSLSAEDIPAGWTIGAGGKDLSSEQYDGTFSFAGSDHEVLQDGRNRYFGSVRIDVSVPENTTGYFSFTVLVTSDWRVMEKGVLVETYTNDTNGEEKKPSIDRVWLEAEGMNLYIYAEVSDVPEGAIITGWVQPCQESTSGYCGAPIDITMAQSTAGTYRGTVQGIDLATFSHLTYRVRVGLNGTELVASEDQKDPISDHITLEPRENGKENEIPWSIIGATMVAALVVIVIITLVIIRAGSRKKDDNGSSIYEEKEPISNEELDAMVQGFPLPPMPMSTAQEGPDGTSRDKSVDTQPEGEVDGKEIPSSREPVPEGLGDDGQQPAPIGMEGQEAPQNEPPSEDPIGSDDAPGSTDDQGLTPFEPGPETSKDPIPPPTREQEPLVQ